MSVERTVFYTRLGIGVFDPLWWEFRLRLFQAVTVPSIARFCRQGALWVLVIDEDIPEHAHAQVMEITRRAGLTEHVTFLPVQFWPDIAKGLQRLVRDRFDTGHVGLVRVDDDDALSSGFLSRAMAQRAGDLAEPTVITLASGWEVAAADRLMRPMHFPFGSINTLYWGPAQLVQDFARIGHHRVEEWARGRGGRVVIDADGPPAWFYIRHKQSDSSYPTRRRLIREDERQRKMTAATYEDAGIDRDAFQQWRDYASQAPTLPPKTWDRGADLVQRAIELRAELAEVKGQLRLANSRIVPREDDRLCSACGGSGAIDTPTSLDDHEATSPGHRFQVCGPCAGTGAA